MADQAKLDQLNKGTPYSEINRDGMRVDFSDAHVKGNFSGVKINNVNFAGSRLCGSTFKGTYIDGCDFQNSDWTGCDFAGATFNGGNLRGIKNAHRAKNLHTALANGFLTGFETAVRPWWIKLDWELMGIVGRLPFFTASTTVLVLLPVFIYFLDLYNQYLEAWKTALGAHATTSLSAEIASAALARLSPLEIPSLSLAALISALFLFVGSLLYSCLCPGRIKQFSRHQWRDELQRSLLDYWPHAWRFSVIRMICALCYLIGGILAVWIIGTKLVSTFVYIIRN
jgi:uncharacterized protein YjbI with pentapeptide repeats